MPRHKGFHTIAIRHCLAQRHHAFQNSSNQYGDKPITRRNQRAPSHELKILSNTFETITGPVEHVMKGHNCHTPQYTSAREGGEGRLVEEKSVDCSRGMLTLLKKRRAERDGEIECSYHSLPQLAACCRPTPSCVCLLWISRQGESLRWLSITHITP